MFFSALQSSWIFVCLLGVFNQDFHCSAGLWSSLTFAKVEQGADEKTAYFFFKERKCISWKIVQIYTLNGTYQYYDERLEELK